MEGWGGVRVVSSLIWMAIEHPEVMVWLLVPVRAHWNAYGVDPPCSYMGALPTPCTDSSRLNIDFIRVGSVRAVVDRTYPLAEAVEAFSYLAAGRATGKVVVEVGVGGGR